MTHIQELLFSHQEKEYGDFISKLTPSVKREYFIGVRVPHIRALVKELSNEEKEEFLNSLPHKYYEENLLHGFVIQSLKDYDSIIKRLNEFLPLVDNWAVSDTMTPKVFKKNRDKLIKEIDKWINSKNTYAIRFGIQQLFSWYLEDDEYYDVNYMYKVANIKSDEYYINIMIAWYFQEAVMKKPNDAIKILESKTLDKWIQNKAIQKCKESNRIPQSTKEYLLTLKK